MNNLKRTWATDYTVVSNTLVNCFGLNPMTRFLCIFLSAQSDNFQFNNSILCQALNCSEATLRKYMKEAIQHGLVRRTRITVNGKFGFFDYELIDPTTLQNLPHGKKTKAVKNQGGKSIRLNKEELSNKEEYSNKVGKDSKGASLEKLIEAEPPTAERLDELLPQGGSVKKEKNSAKKENERPVTAATAARRDAMILELSGQPAPAQPTIEQSTEAIMADLETDEGQRKLKFAAGRGGVKTMPANLFAAVARYVEHCHERGRPVHADPITRLGGYLKYQASKEARQVETNEYHKNKKTSNANRSPRTRQPAQPIISRAQSITLAEKLLAERAAQRAANQ